jgi:lactate 2-monooxygenase
MSTNYGDYQLGVYLQGMMGQQPDFPFEVEEVERRAKEQLDPKAYWYVAGGAGAGETVERNRRAFNRWQLVPRMLADVSERDHRVELLGQTFPSPLLLGPVGVQEIIHPEGELAVARAAKSLGVPMVLSTLSSFPLEEVAETLGDSPKWFQLYWPGDPALATSLVQRAEAAGYTAIVVTLDTKLMGWREKDLQTAYLPFLERKGIANYLTDPVFCGALDGPPEENMLAAVGHWAQVYADASQTWADLAALREATKLPIVLKGVLHPDDARIALDHGVDSIIVSNHGGRQVDGAIAALDALPAVVDRVPTMPVLFDSGIRHGADMVKALALGAKAVLLARPYVYGLAVDGEEGVKNVVQRLLAEFDVTMALAGVATTSELERGHLVREVQLP